MHQLVKIFYHFCTKCVNKDIILYSKSDIFISMIHNKLKVNVWPIPLSLTDILSLVQLVLFGMLNNTFSRCAEFLLFAKCHGNHTSYCWLNDDIHTLPSNKFDKECCCFAPSVSKVIRRVKTADNGMMYTLSKHEFVDIKSDLVTWHELDMIKVY